MKLAKKLGGDKPNLNMMTLEKGSRLLNQKEAVQTLMEYLGVMGKLDNVDQAKKNQIKKELQTYLKEAKSVLDEMDAPFTMLELNNALSFLKIKSSPG